MDRHDVRRALIACAVAAALGTAPPPARAASVVGLDQGDTGRQVALRTGQTLRLHLHGDDPSTGHHWTTALEASARVLRRRSSESVTLPPCPPGTVGCATRLVVRYEAAAPGTASLRLVRRAPGGRAVGVFSPSVRVRRTVPPAREARFAGRTAEGLPVSLTTSTGGRAVTRLRLTLAAAACGGERMTATFPRLRVAADGTIAGRFEHKTPDGTQSSSLHARVEGGQASGTIRRAFVAATGDEALGGGPACTDRVQFRAHATSGGR